MNSSIRPELLEAYSLVFSSRLPKGKERSPNNEPGIPATLVNLDPKEVTRYERHGHAKVKIPVYFGTVSVLIDLANVRNLEPLSAYWISRQLPYALELIISSGKQPLALKANSFQEGRQLMGLHIDLHPTMNPKSPVRYRPNLTPLFER